MPQVGIAAFDRVGLTFIWHGRVARLAIHQIPIRGQAVAVIRPRLGRLVDHSLQGRRVPFRHPAPANEGVGRAVHRRYDVDPVFFCPMNVYNSSNSTVSLVVGAGGVSGRRSAAAVTQLITV